MKYLMHINLEPFLSLLVATKTSCHNLQLLWYVSDFWNWKFARQVHNFLFEVYHPLLPYKILENHFKFNSNIKLQLEKSSQSFPQKTVLLLSIFFKTWNVWGFTPTFKCLCFLSINSSLVDLLKRNWILDNSY